MVVLIDANIILDYILKREPFYAAAQKVMQLCSTETVDGYIALHTITTIWYLLRKLPDAVRRNALTAICNLLQVTGTTHEEVLHAIQMTTLKILKIAFKANVQNLQMQITSLQEMFLIF